MNYADRACDLECIGKGAQNIQGPRHEFIGPVKIVLVESTPVDYKRKIWGSAIYTIVLLLHGATVFTVLFFAMSFILPIRVNAHIVLGTLGFHIFLTAGIMMLNSLFGGSTYQMPSDRKFQHFFLELFAMLCGCASTGCAYNLIKFKAISIHGGTGAAATFLIVLCCLIGPTAYFAKPEKMYGQFNKKSHVIVAVPTFLTATACFVMGLRKDSFIQWAPIPHLHDILCAFTGLYCLTVFGSILLRRKYGH